jgi:CheY-like chemotaxis protein
VKGYILVVDDEPAIRFVYQEFLGGEGHRVTGADCGSSALAAASRERPSLALVDLNLPDMSGLEVIRSLKKMHPDLPVAVISATPRQGFLSALEALGVHGFFEKPIDLEELGELVTRLAS